MYVLCQYTLTIYGFLIIENRKYHQEMEEALPPEIVDGKKKEYNYSYKKKMCYATYTSTTTLKSHMKHDHLGNEKYVCIVCRIKLSCNNNK